MALFTRRGFTKLLLIGTGLNLAAGATMEVYLLPNGRFRELVMSALLKRAGDLGFTDADFEKFTADYQAHHYVDRREELLGYAWPVYRWTELLEQSAGMQSKLENWEEKLLTQFLLSTDYFLEGRETAPKYLALYAPGKRPCQNPFARRRPIDG